MTTANLAAFYLLVGAGCAAVRVARGGLGRAVVTDAGLLLLFWPLVAPFFVLQGADDDAPRAGSVGDEADEDFARALARASETPLGQLLPDRATVDTLRERLRLAARRAREIDALLREPELDEEAAVRRASELQQQGRREAAETVMGRVHKIRYIRSLGLHFRRELDAIRELLAQVRIQAEVVRLAGDADGSARALMTRLFGRIEGLDTALEEGSREGLWPGREPS